MPAEAGRRDSWRRILIDLDALEHNIGLFRQLVRPPARLLATVKAEAYGHGLCEAAAAFLAGGADLLGVHSVDEAGRLRADGLDAPILVLGPATAAEAQWAAAQGVELTLTSLEMARELAAVPAAGPPIRLHLKVETGLNRQGVAEAEIAPVLQILASSSRLRLTGLSSHFADIEDTTDHAFARQQRTRFEAIAAQLAAAGHADLCRHMSCSAAAILWPDSHRDLVRVGISAYGLWPSRETLVSAQESGRGRLDLRPALTWCCRVGQVKEVPEGQAVGYGRTWQAPVASRIAVLPVGYADGYPRRLSGRAYVLLRGRRAPLVGRICMNLCMADVTHIAGAQAGDEAVLLGSQGAERISAEQLAAYLDTIAYEVLTLPGASWSREAVRSGKGS